jgi:hypothetical protein
VTSREPLLAFFQFPVYPLLFSLIAPSAKTHLLPEAGATQERRL